MPREGSQGDALRLYLTGAAGAGGAQADPNESLGLYRSSTQLQSVGFLLEGDLLPGIVIDHVAAGNGLGDGLLSAAGTNALAWTPPGGLRGEPVRILNGETKVVAGAGDAGAYARVSRQATTELDGTTIVKILDRFWGLFDLVEDAERSAGDTEYRCIALLAGAGSIVHQLKLWLDLLGTATGVDSGYGTGDEVINVGPGDLLDWPETGWVLNVERGEVMYYASRTETALDVRAADRDLWNETGGGAGVGVAGVAGDDLRPISGVRIALEAPDAQPDGAFSDLTADEDGPAPPVTFVHPTAIDDPDVLEAPDFLDGQTQGLWIQRRVPADAAATPRASVRLRFDFVAVGG